MTEAAGSVWRASYIRQGCCIQQYCSGQPLCFQNTHRTTRKNSGGTEAVTFCFCEKDMDPHYTVEKEKGKIGLSKKKPPQIKWDKVWDAKTLVLMVKKLHQSCNIHKWEQRSEKLGHVTHFSIMTDISSSKSSDPYLSLTIKKTKCWQKTRTSCLQIFQMYSWRPYGLFKL